MSAVLAMTASSLLAPSLLTPSSAGAASGAGEDQAPLQLTIGDWLDTSDRQAVIDSYDSMFSAAVPDMEWTGDAATCDTGDISSAYRSASIDRVNWYRSMAGVPAVTENLAYSEAAQTATLIQAFGTTLEHEPTGGMCFSEAGAHASARSNLTRGRSELRGIDSFVRDPGVGNERVGHRNWILNPTSQEFGIGAVEGVNDKGTVTVLKLYDDSADVDTVPIPPMRESESFVAWPVNGYNPSQVVYDRWSFGIPGADLSAATVSTERFVDGAFVAIPSPVIFSTDHSDGAPVNLVVWEPELDYSSATTSLHTLAVDETYRVTISNVGVENTVMTFTYDVTVIGDEFAPRPEAVDVVTDIRTTPEIEPEPELTPLEEFLRDPSLNRNHSMVLRLYWVVFDRAPDVGGARFWVDHFNTSGDIDWIAHYFVESPEFVELYGGDISNREFVSRIYENVFGRDPDASGFAFWVGELDSGAKSRARVMLEFSASDEFTSSHPLPSDDVPVPN